MSALVNDLRFGFRMLVRTPLLSVVAVLTMGLGVGSTTFVYSISYRMVLAGLPVQDADLETFKQLIGTGMVGAFPDLAVSVAELIAEGNRVAARWSFSGTHNGELPGDPPLPPTGKRVSVNIMSIHRLASGKIAESWVVFDAMGMMQQLGVVPGPGEGDG